MSHASNSNTTIVADLTAACTGTADADFTTSGGAAVAGVGGVVAGILPDTILFSAPAGASVLTLPKIGTQACPVGSTVAIRRYAAGGGVITVTAHPTSGGGADAGDLIDGAATAGALVFPADATKQSAIFRACSIAAPVAPALNGVGQWRTIMSSVAGI